MAKIKQKSKFHILGFIIIFIIVLGTIVYAYQVKTTYEEMPIQLKTASKNVVKINNDLTIANVAVNPENPGIGDQIVLSVEVVNKGLNSATPFIVSAQDQIKWTATGSSGVLEAGKTAIVYLFLNASPKYQDILLANNPHEFTVFADTNNQVKEDNESNNTYKLKINVAPPKYEQTAKLIIQAHPYTIQPKQIEAGRYDVIAHRILFKALNEDVLIEKLSLETKVYNNEMANNSAIKNVTIKYPQLASSPNELDGQRSMNLDSNGRANFADLKLAIPKNAESYAEIFVSLNEMDPSAGSMKSGDFVKIAFDCTKDDSNILQFTGQTSNKGSTIKSLNINCNNGEDISSYPMFIRRSLPKFTLTDDSPKILSYGLNQEVLKFEVTASDRGDIGIERILLGAEGSGLNAQYLASNWQLYNLNGKDPSVPISIAKLENKILQFNFNEQYLGRGNKAVFSLKADVLDDGINNGNYLTLTFVTDTYGDVVYQIEGEQRVESYGQVSASPTYKDSNLPWNKLIWSDHSALQHSESTPDWTNAFLLRLPSGVTLK